MKIAIIGAGNVGGALAAKWSKVGHTVIVAGRDEAKTKAKAEQTGATAASPKNAAANADVLVFAVPFADLVEVAKTAGDLVGKILIDATNIVGPSARTSESPALALAKAIPGAKVVKTFNTAFAQIHADQHLPRLRSGEEGPVLLLLQTLTPAESGWCGRLGRGGVEVAYRKE